MMRARLVTLAVPLVLVTACGQDRPKDQYSLIEYVEVQGSCFEDHVRQTGKYVGSIVHWRNMTKNTERRYGSVNRWPSNEEMVEKVGSPHKYFLPSIIAFDDVAGDDLHRPNFTAKGLSEHVTARSDNSGPHYEATCHLTVVKRSPTLPPASERR
jgi:hypothetical protein